MKKISTCETMRATHVRTRTTCRRHITREFGLKKCRRFALATRENMRTTHETTWTTRETTWTTRETTWTTRETTLTTRVRSRTTSRRHITRKFGLQSRKKNWGRGENRGKETLGEQR